MPSKKRPNSHNVTRQAPKVDRAVIRSKIVDGSLLGFAQIWPGGKSQWDKLTTKQKRLFFQSFEVLISNGQILDQLPLGCSRHEFSKDWWTWAPTNSELKIIDSLSREFAATFAREEEAERKALEAQRRAERERAEVEENHKKAIIAAKVDARKLQAAWAFKHEKMLQALGADLRWCERVVRPKIVF